MFFLAVYIHIGRGLYYGSYKAPREVLWIIGVMILLLMMATAFMGYSLPWGQMSFWAVTVITNLFSSVDSIVPGLGTRIVQWLWGGYAVSGTTLTRFYSLHYLLPFVIVGVVGLHIWALHVVGQNNPTGLEIKTASDSVPMSPHAVMKDMFAPGCVRAAVCLVRVLSCRTIWATPTTTSRPIRSRRRRTSCRSGTSCPTTRSCARSRTSCWA